MKHIDQYDPYRNDIYNVVKNLFTLGIIVGQKILLKIKSTQISLQKKYITHLKTLSKYITSL